MKNEPSLEQSSDDSSADYQDYQEVDEVIPQEPNKSDKKFIEELSGDNIERLNLLILGGNGAEVKFSDIYEYKHFLGKGGFGYVVSAIHRESKQAVALKVSRFEVLSSVSLAV